MKKLALFLCAGLLSACSPRAEQATMPQASQEPKVLIIFYAAQIGSEPLKAEIKRYPAEIVYEYQTLNGIAIKLPETKSLTQATEDFSKVKGVLTVNPDQKMQLH